MSTPNVKFAKVVYWAAGIWGVLILTPLFFIFNTIGLKDPPPSRIHSSITASPAPLSPGKPPS